MPKQQCLQQMQQLDGECRAAVVDACHAWMHADANMQGTEGLQHEDRRSVQHRATIRTAHTKA